MKIAKTNSLYFTHTLVNKRNSKPAVSKKKKKQRTRTNRKAKRKQPTEKRRKNNKNKHKQQKKERKKKKQNKTKNKKTDKKQQKKKKKPQNGSKQDHNDRSASQKHLRLKQFRPDTQKQEHTRNWIKPRRPFWQNNMLKTKLWETNTEQTTTTNFTNNLKPSHQKINNQKQIKTTCSNKTPNQKPISKKKNKHPKLKRTHLQPTKQPKSTWNQKPQRKVKKEAKQNTIQDHKLQN
ncbi:hypothetical protein HYD99_04155 [Mycoplasmopsis bovis]|nr:hypothetical protein [Mycoplasmopsis bovis]QQH29070.1 hypothetical protein HYD99_04155 [Mycoplasmopsis bovis]